VGGVSANSLAEECADRPPDWSSPEKVDGLRRLL